MVEITLNSNTKEVSENSTIYHLLSDKQKESKFLVIEYNGELLDKENWQKTLLKEGDDVNIIGFVGGG